MRNQQSTITDQQALRQVRHLYGMLTKLQAKWTNDAQGQAKNFRR
jgi:hypothetical protein